MRLRRLRAFPRWLLARMLKRLRPLVGRILVAGFPWTAKNVFGYSAPSLSAAPGPRPAVTPAGGPRPDLERWRHQDGLEVPQSALDAFYDSWSWKMCSYRFRQIWREKCKPICMCCGVDQHSRRLDVDHIRPLRHNWSKRSDWNNLQMLCTDCNRGKGSWDATDYRPAYFKAHIAAIVAQLRSEGRVDP